VLSNLELVLGDKLDSASSAATVTDTKNSTTGIGAALDDFFSAFSNLSANPADIPARSAALAAANALADRLNLADERVAAAQVDQEGQITSDVSNANRLLADIAELNAQIRQAPDVEAGGASQLIDTRQAKLEQLAALVKLDIVKDPKDPVELNISLGGVVLVNQGQLVNQISYLTEKQAAELSVAGSLGTRTQGFEVGTFDQAGNFTPSLVSVGGASALRTADIVAGANLPSTPPNPATTIVARLDGSTIQLSQKATTTGYFALTVNGVANTRIAYSTVGSNVVTLSNSASYEVVPAGGSAQGRFQAVFGSPTASAMTSKGIRSQLADLAATIKAQVNGIYNASGTGTNLFGSVDVSLAGPAVGKTTTAGSRTVSVVDTTGLVVGMHVSGTGIPSGATVAAILGTNKFALNVPATADSLTSATILASRSLLSIDPTITASSLQVAAPGGPAGSNAIATRIAALKDVAQRWNSPVGGGSQFNANISDFSRGLMTGLAQTIQLVGTRADESEVVGNAVKAQRDSVSGVSLDEETADLLRFQKAYQANAKVISIIDDMLSSLISMVR
jgi:flagellar hook-associated protein 1 FlgK